MSNYSQQNPYQVSDYGGYAPVAADADAWARSVFIRKTYAHLAVAIAAFVMIEAAIFTLIPEDTLGQLVMRMFGGRWSWLIVLGAFMGVSWLANSWASSATSLAVQYLGLALYVVAESIIFVPLLFMASYLERHSVGQSHIIATAGVMTGVIFAGLTAMVFLTKADLSGLGKYLWLGGLAALGYVLCSAVFGFSGPGLIFVSLMIALAGGYILYDTSNVLHHYRTDQHVAAALALFASVALLFWYLLRFVMALSSRD